MVDGDTEREGWYGVMMLWWWWWQYSTATHMFGAFDVRHLPILLQHLLQQPHIFDLETGKLTNVCVYVYVYRLCLTKAGCMGIKAICIDIYIWRLH